MEKLQTRTEIKSCGTFMLEEYNNVSITKPMTYSSKEKFRVGESRRERNKEI